MGFRKISPSSTIPEHSCAIVHSDSGDGIQRLNQEAAKAMAHGARVGLTVPPERAIRWLTLNPAKSLGLDDRIGTLEAGKGADLVIWNGNPFSVYALAEQVFIDGALSFDRAHPQIHAAIRFPVGQAHCGVATMKSLHLVVLAASLIGAQGATAQEFVIRGATVHTASAKGTLKNTDVLVRGGVIVAIGSGTAAPNATVIDAKGRELTPGLFGGLTDIGIEEIGGESANRRCDS